MCLWLLTACIGLLPTYTPPANVVIQLPPSILQPTTAATTAAPTTTTAARPPSPPTPTTASNTPATPTPSVTTAPPVTAAPTTPVPPMTPAPTTPAPSPVMTATSPTTNQPPMTTISSATTLPTTASPSLGQLLLPVLLCNNTEVVCVLNPDYYAVNTGPLRIDPRLGTTPAASAAFRIPPINGYNANSLTLDTSVRFPRERRSIKGSDNSTGIKEFLATVKRPDGHRIRKRQSCMCVAAGTCATYGAGLIDLRIVSPGATQCPAGQVYCCTGTVTPTTTPVVTVACGVTQTVPTTGVVPAAGQASFGEYPWQAMVLTKQNDYIAGAVLINQQHVLTGTHRLTGYIVGGTAPNLKVRLGEWDAAATYEPIPFQEYNVTRVFSHPSFNPNTLQYDLTVLRLTPSVPLTQQTGAARTINRACLPPSSNTVYTGQRCWVSGWGKNMFGVTGQYQQILKEVDVPIVAPATCQSQMQTARLGSTFVLDTTSFICAGGEANKDACTGDGGSGLVCQVNGQWVLVGLVSWGLGCANANVPGAYVNVAALLPWIQQQVAAA